MMSAAARILARRKRHDASSLAGLSGAQLDQLHAEGAKRPRVLSIAIHPFLIGHPFRARHLDRALAYLKKKKGVWLATGSEILDWWHTATKPQLRRRSP